MQESDASGGFWGATNRASVLVTRHIDYTSHWLEFGCPDSHSHPPHAGTGKATAIRVICLSENLVKMTLQIPQDTWEACVLEP